MPAFLEAKLRSEARKRGLKTPDAINAYVYGTMNNRGYMRGNKETRKGQNAQKKHNKDVKAGRTR